MFKALYIIALSIIFILIEYQVFSVSPTDSIHIIAFVRQRKPDISPISYIILGYFTLHRTRITTVCDGAIRFSFFCVVF